MKAVRPAPNARSSSRSLPITGAPGSGNRAEPLAPGELVAARFKVEALAGVGGMGSVYRALDLQTRSAVALKVVATSDGTEPERFAREARALSQISHPAVVGYVAHGMTDRRVPYLAMEWLAGEDLGARLDRAGLTVQETLRLMERICSGLAVAHAKGLVHRDLKPSNLFLVEGRPEAAKLIDFGVARQLRTERTITRAGSALGTIGYLAPEQAMGVHDVDARADVFALGCVLFECLTGQAPFRGPHDVAVLAMLLGDDVPRASALRPDLDPRLDALVSSMLAKDRAQRPDHAGALLQRLRALGELSGAAPPAVGKRRPELANAEQRIASVVLAREMGPAPATLSTRQAEAEAKQLEGLFQRFGAQPVPIRPGQLLLLFSSAPGVIASDQAMQAVRCALSLRKLKPTLAIGVGTGSISAALNVSVGVAIERAHALLQNSSDDCVCRGVLVDPLTAGLLNGAFEVEERALNLTVLGELDGSERPRLLLGRPSPCLGRDKELGLLEATLAECIDDRVAHALLISAPPGIGKSRLAAEFLQRVRRSGQARALIARADPTTMRSPLQVLQRLLDHAFGVRKSDPAELRAAQLTAYLSALGGSGTHDLLAEFLSELMDLPVSAPGGLLLAARNEPALMRVQTRRAVEGWLAAEVARTPLLILIEDVQWADAASIQCLVQSVQALKELPIFVLALGRPETNEHVPELFKAFGSQELRLSGLTRRAAERLAREMLPASTEREVFARIVDLADGNAFYLEELIRRVAEGSTELPETVRTIVRSRLDNLAPEARQHLRSASVFGETCWTGGVRTLLGNGAESENWLALLARDEILLRSPESRFPGQVQYVFRHALLRDAAYGMLGDDERRAAHAAAAEWLAEAGERDPGVLADHFERSDATECATPFLLQAARQALSGGTLDAAVAFARRGLTLGGGGPQRGELLLVEAHASAWGTRTNLDLAREALELLPRASGSWWSALSLLVFGSTAVGRGDLAAPYLELAKSTPAPVAERIGAYGQAFEVLALGGVLLGRGDIGWSMLGKAQELIANTYDPVSQAWLHLTRCQLSTNTLHDGSWELELAVQAGRDAVAGMRASGAASGEATALFHLGIALREIGDYEQAEAAISGSLQLATKVGNVLMAEFSRLVLAISALYRGNRQQCLDELPQLARSSDANMVHACQNVRAQIALRTGDLTSAVLLAERAIHGPGLLHSLTAALILARAEHKRGNHGHALEVLRATFEKRDRALFPQLELDLLTLRAQLYSAAGRHDEARAAHSAALSFATDTAALIRNSALRTAFERRSA